MKTIIALIIAACGICLIAADPPSLVKEVKLGSTMTNHISQNITNIVFEAGVAYAELDITLKKMPVSAAGVSNIINSLVASGEFCRVRGHVWGEHFHTTLVYSPNHGGCRECKVCGLHQERTLTDWK